MCGLHVWRCSDPRPAHHRWVRSLLRTPHVCVSQTPGVYIRVEDLLLLRNCGWPSAAQRKRIIACRGYTWGPTAFKPALKTSETGCRQATSKMDPSQQDNTSQYALVTDHNYHTSMHPSLATSGPTKRLIKPIQVGRRGSSTRPASRRPSTCPAAAGKAVAGSTHECRVVHPLRVIVAHTCPRAGRAAAIQRTVRAAG